MKKAKIVTLPGDGIGPSIMNAALSILKVVAEEHDLNFEIVEKPFGGAAIDQCGHPYPGETREALHEADAILLAAIGGPQYDDAEVRPEQGLLMMRKDLNLFANFRPVNVPQSMSDLSPLKEEIVTGTDFVVCRELTGGAYFGDKEEGNEYAQDIMGYSREEVERVARKAFDLARTRRKKVTSVDKANVLASSRLWRHTVAEVAKDYPDVELENAYVDATAMKIVTHPTDFDVILTENLFGDILSDESSVLTGSLGMLPSSSQSEDGPSLYEPIHGSAPDIAGKDIANPMSMILSVTMMLRQSFGLYDEADEIEEACYGTIDSGVKTRDIGGTASTSEFTDAVIQRLKDNKN